MLHILSYFSRYFDCKFSFKKNFNDLIIENSLVILFNNYENI